MSASVILCVFVFFYIASIKCACMHMLVHVLIIVAHFPHLFPQAAIAISMGGVNKEYKGEGPREKQKNRKNKLCACHSCLLSFSACLLVAFVFGNIQNKYGTAL